MIIYFEESEHKLFVREGNDIFINCWIQYPQAVFGTSIEVPTLSGKVKLKIPGGIKSGQILRLRGKGLPELNRNFNETVTPEQDLEWKEMVGRGKYEMLEGEPKFDLGVVEYNTRNVNPDRTIDHEFF